MDTKDYKEIENLELGMHEEDEKNSWSSLWEPREFDNIVSYVITPMREKAIKNNISEDGAPIELNSDIGGIFRVTSDGRTVPLLPETLGIMNTLAWSPNNRKFFFADSMKGTLFSAIHNTDGTLGSIKRFNTDCPLGVPDGSAMDEEGYLWNARWGGSSIVRFDPSGNMDRTVNIPATNVTSCCFGGPDLKTLFVTTAQSGLSRQTVDENPNEGALFAVDCGVRGMPISAFLD